MVQRSPDAGHVPSLWPFEWRWVPGLEAVDQAGLVDSCARLFSDNYGIWGPEGPRPGEPIRMPPGRVAHLLDHDDAWLACAWLDGDLVGYCASVRLDVPGRGMASWVTQLVVNETYRNLRVATRLLFGNWQFSDFYAWGLATANPLAIRALETATRRQCVRREIVSRGPELLAALADRVDYLPDRLVTDERGALQPRVNTQFFVDLSGIDELRRKAARGERPWDLGRVEPGEEWFACTFSSQVPDSIDATRLEELLTGSDRIWIQGYERMNLDQAHRWHRHTTDEAALVSETLGLSPGALVLDVGCGDGRHARALAGQGFRVTAVDVAPGLVERARELARSEGVEFAVMDARQELPEGPFDAAICLYDVIGSSADPEDDLALLRNIHSSLKPGGRLIASVMNGAVTEPRLASNRKPATETEFVEALERLPPSRTMETTGDIFDPEYLLLYAGVHYRKEQFASPGQRLPAELVVRDRRYHIAELIDLLQQAGFDVATVMPVQSGHWRRDPPLDASDARAKELFAIARRG